MIGESVTEKQLQDMLNLADVDKDGRINYEGELSLLKNVFDSHGNSSNHFRVCEVVIVTCSK